MTVTLDEPARVTSAVPVPGVSAAGHRRAVHGRQRADQAGARVPGGARPAGPDRHVGHSRGRLAGRVLRARPRQVGAAAGPGRRLRARRAAPQPVRAADREPGRDLGPGRRRDRRAAGRGPGAAAGRPRPVRRRRHRAAPRARRAADPAAGRPRVHRRRRAAALGSLAAAGLAAPGRGPGAARGHLHRGDEAAADPVPRVDVGDGRALRVDGDEPLVEERVRRRRVRARAVRQLPGARLRLPGRDRVPGRRPGRRRRAPRRRCATPSACTKRTTACSGSTSTGGTG